MVTTLDFIAVLAEEEFENYAWMNLNFDWGLGGGFWLEVSGKIR
jgi:hypothetical protein